jgi:hypothetical protein
MSEDCIPEAHSIALDDYGNPTGPVDQKRGGYCVKTTEEPRDIVISTTDDMMIKKHETAARVCLLEFSEPGDFGVAGGAVGGPKSQKDHFASQVTDFDRHSSRIR